MSPEKKLGLLLRGWAAVVLAAACLHAQEPVSHPQEQTAQTQPAPAPVVSLTTGTPSELEHQGDIFRSQKRYLDAIDYYDAAIAKQPTPLLWNKKGMAYLFIQHNKEAKKCFESAVQQDKNSAEGLNNLGYMAQLEKRYNRAIKYYEKALAVRPNSATFHYNLGAAYFSKHKFEQATQEYRTALQLDPDVFVRASKMGIMVQSSTPEDRAAFAFMVAKMYAQAGNLDRSLEYLRKAMEDGYKQINQVYKDNEFAVLRTDPRFTELMAQKPQPIQ